MTEPNEEPSDQPVENLAAPENETNVDEAAPGNRAVANNVTPARGPVGLLDLPSELRLMIFRHLLIFPMNLGLPKYEQNCILGPSVGPFVAILRTSRLIHSESFDVLYRENVFPDCLWASSYSNYSLTLFPRVIDSMQNINIHIPIQPGYFPTTTFLSYLHLFGNTSTTRGTLVLEFSFTGPRAPLEEWSIALKWFVRALGAFTNFRTIELHARYTELHARRIGARDHMFDVLEYFETELEHVLGYAENSSHEGNGLIFHPPAHRNRWREPDRGDWADFLDGIYLEWNEDVTNPDNSEPLAQN